MYIYVYVYMCIYICICIYIYIYKHSHVYSNLVTRQTLRTFFLRFCVRVFPGYFRTCGLHFPGQRFFTVPGRLSYKPECVFVCFPNFSLEAETTGWQTGTKPSRVLSTFVMLTGVCLALFASAFCCTCSASRGSTKKQQ